MLRKALKSKTSVPQIFHKLLPRENIAAIVDRASLDEAVCLVAPYGFGKTLAVLSWLHINGRNAAWITLDESDNTEQVFFAGLSAAILRLTGWEGFSGDILSDGNYLNNPQGFLWEAIAVAEKSVRDKILVLDNFHFIRDLSLLRLIKETLSELLGRWRIIIASRAEMPPVFNDLMLKRHICMVALDELGYSVEETAEFFRVNDYDASQPEIKRIHEETEGWPAALNVIATISRGDPIEYGEAAQKYITGFFETEIWADLDKNTKMFLLKTSVLDRLTPAACNAVTNMGATLPVLRRLFVNGMFIFRLNNTDSYRYHSVFRSFLRDKLDASGFDVKVLHKKVAWWLFERDAFEQAFPYFFKAGDLYGLSRVLRVINSAEIGLERYLELTGCITSLDVEDLREYPLIVAKTALIHYALGDIAEMRRLYNIFIEWIEPGVLPIPPEEYAECVWEAGWLSYLNPFEPLISKRHEEWLNYAEYDPRLQKLHHARAAVYRFPSMLRGIRDYCPILNALEENIRDNNDSDYGGISGEVSVWKLDIVRAEYAYELENFALAEELIKNVLAKVEGRQIADLCFVCIALLSKIVRAIYNPKEIMALTTRLETMINKSGHAFLPPRFHAFVLRNRLLEGIIGQTEEFERENRNYIEKPYFYLLYRHITLARALLSTGNYNEADLLLGNLERLCHQYNRTMDLIEVYILKAIADFGLRNEEGARRHITAALNDARKYGFIRIFSDDAKDIWPILELLDDNMRDRYINKIIISCKKTLARSGMNIRRKSRAQSELTKTELKILKALDTGISYKELAIDNDIKLSTVKSHIQSIYSKLGVDNRTSAVITAREMGIIG